MKAGRRGNAAEIGLRPGGGAGLERTEGLFDLGCNGGRVEIADGDDGEILGTIPGVVEIHELLARRFLDDLRQSDGHAFRDQRIGQQEIVFGDPGAILDGIAGALFGEDDAALLVDLRGFNQQAAGVVSENLETLGQGCRQGVRQFEQIDRAVE